MRHMEDLASKSLIDPVIPNKLYFRIGEVAKLAGIKPYVLRFWESEFTGLGPKKSGTGHRLYRRKDVELVLEIKRLLYEKRFTIEGARKILEQKPKRSAESSVKSPAAAAPASSRRQQGELFGGISSAFYQELRKELTDLLTLLQD
jgi:DNA-binding transcriptional MerR regulator